MFRSRTTALLLWAFYNADLPLHNSRLDSEQAARINDNFTIEIAVGVHGLAGQDLTGVVPDARKDYYEHIARTTPAEYDGIDELIGRMEAGDAIFREKYGFEDQAPRSLTAGELQLASTPLSMLTPEERRMRTIIDRLKDNVEQARQARTVDAWQYAEYRAVLKGIHVIYADHDALDVMYVNKMTQGRGLMDLELRSAQLTPEERAIQDEMHVQRTRKAIMTMKDWALAHLPPVYDPYGRPRMLVPLYGEFHKDDLERELDNLGLDFTTTILPYSNLTERSVGYVNEKASSIGGSSILTAGFMS